MNGSSSAFIIIFLGVLLSVTAAIEPISSTIQSLSSSSQEQNQELVKLSNQELNITNTFENITSSNNTVIFNATNVGTASIPVDKMTLLFDNQAVSLETNDSTCFDVDTLVDNITYTGQQLSISESESISSNITIKCNRFKNPRQIKLITSNGLSYRKDI
jgi:archaellum component FlaF (FlaF/FlaG flagellin family)